MKRAGLFLLTMVLWAAALLGTVNAEQTVDMDLSACNRAMTYAQMMQVYRAPEDYAGKLFCLKGKFNYSSLHDQAMIIFSDRAGCCEIAFPFQPAQALTYPDDYPPLYADILLTARWAVPADDPEASCYFCDAVIAWE
ncbi:MAG: hypothetical protein IJQ33_01220 [Clostridia bacterium]|nr:hypothetical protein [Clostridia bacterium]